MNLLQLRATANLEISGTVKICIEFPLNKNSEVVVVAAAVVENKRSGRRRRSGV